MSAKKRGTNFSNTEKILLIELVTKYKSIIENKKTDAVFAKEKMKCWDNISKEFNSESNIFRDAITLKSCWENLKKRTRKYYAEQRNQLYKTGGGPCETQHDPIMEKMYSIINASVDGLNNNFDNDNMEDNVYFTHDNSDPEDASYDSNVVSVEDLLEEPQASSDSEDCIVKYIDTMQDTSDSSSHIAGNINKNKCVDMKRKFGKEITEVAYKSQKNNRARPECIVTKTNKQMINPRQKMEKNTSITNILKKKISHETQKENMRIDSVSSKVLKTTVADSKKELIELMKIDSEKNMI